MKNNPRISYLYGSPVSGDEADISDIKKFGLSEKEAKKLNGNFWDLARTAPPDTLGHASDFAQNEQKLSEYVHFFKNHFGFEPFSLNRYWARKTLSGQSFSIIAPTGFGKTTFGYTVSHFFEGKVYYVVPTKILLREIAEKLQNIASGKKVCVADEKLDKTEIKKQEYDILLTTSHFLHKHFTLLPKNFDLVFVDDADSLIRQPQNIDKLLTLVGFSKKEIDNAIEVIDKKRRAHRPQDYEVIGNAKISKKKKGQIIAASATLSPRTKRIHLFRELLGFEIGYSSTFLRNIVDGVEDMTENTSFPNKQKLFNQAILRLQQYGKGGFVYLSDDFSKDDFDIFLALCEKNNITAIGYDKFTPPRRKKFIAKEIDIVVGFSNIRNPLTRGIDLPQSVRYALFIGVPKFKLSLRPTLAPKSLFMLMLFLRDFLQADDPDLLKELSYLKRISFLREEQVLKNDQTLERVSAIKEKLEKILENKNFLASIKEKHDLNLISEQDAQNPDKENLYLLVADPRGYLQASGRTSRLFSLGLTQGFSLILSENKKVLHNLQEKLKIMGYRLDFQNNADIDINDLFSRIDRDRSIVKDMMEGRALEFLDPVKTALVIVESPTKAKTIANFFGRPARRIYGNYWVYEVSIGKVMINIVATIGHFAELTHKGSYFGVERIGGDLVPRFQPLRLCKNCSRGLDTEKTCPVCKKKNISDKTQLIDLLRTLASDAQEIYICSDPDAEGEKIAFDLYAYLYPINRKMKRMEIHEVTRSEFLHQFENPREINAPLVCAQLVRRILDRWVGFSLSQQLQKKFKRKNASAGRVQTPILGWIIEKEEERKQKYYFTKIGYTPEINSTATEGFWIEQKETIDAIKKAYKKGGLRAHIEISSTQEKTVNPGPPYTTSDLLKDASMFLKMDAKSTMAVAQNLFERGLITYHRTDSRFVSTLGRSIAREILEKKNLLAKHYSRSWGDQGTHECIRPTRPIEVQDLIEEALLNSEQIMARRQLALYGMIFNRFVASQMKPAQMKTGTYSVSLLGYGRETEDPVLKEETVNIETLEKGYLSIYRNTREHHIVGGDFLVEKLSVKRVSKIAPYSEGSLIDEMKKRKLGRPSTYASILQTVKSRGYVTAKSGFLFPTKAGIETFSYLNKKYHDLISEDMTRNLEAQMDAIEEDTENYQDILKNLFERIFINQ